MRLFWFYLYQFSHGKDIGLRHVFAEKGRKHALGIGEIHKRKLIQLCALPSGLHGAAARDAAESAPAAGEKDSAGAGAAAEKEKAPGRAFGRKKTRDRRANKMHKQRDACLCILLIL